MSSKNIQQAEFTKTLAISLHDTFERVLEDKNAQYEILKQIENIDGLNPTLDPELMKTILIKMLELTLIMKNNEEVFIEFVNLNA